MNNNFAILKKWLRIERSFPIILIVFGLLAVGASMMINIEKVGLLQHPENKLVCDLNPVYSCGKVIDSNQSTLVASIPNDLMGIAIFAPIIAVGVSMLAGAKYKRWFWRLFLACMAAFMLGVAWLFYQSVYVIQALCIFCSTVWISGLTITTALYAWVYDQKLLPNRFQKMPIASIKRKNIIGIWIIIILIAAGLIITHFWYYYGQYFGVK
ncbi:vitamin K epoxide reductase family protein [Candidatus Saccharibacteria bacterium]|nr:vitamin K epoxide reductase family protein [Candidatus Saccharibacteria bacterium]